MAGYRKPEIPRDQMTLWSDRLDDAVPAHHQVRLVAELLDREAFREVLDEMDAAQRQIEGAPAYAPSRLATLVIYGHLIKVRSSRQLESACVNRIDLTWLMEGMKPDHATIARFMERHGPRMKSLLKASVRVAIQAKLVTLEMVAVDGTFIEANAGRKSVRKKKDLEAQLEKVVDAMTREFEDNDEREAAAAAAGILLTTDATMSEAKRQRAFERKKKQLEAALETIERREAEPRRSDQELVPIASTTDPDARHMRDKEGRTKPNYNAQLAVDGEAGVIVGASVSDEANDTAQLLPMLDEVEEVADQAPQTAVFDAGYHTSRAVKKADTHDAEVLVTDPHMSEYRSAADARRTLASGGSLSLPQIEALPRQRGVFHHACFVYDRTTDCYRCPAGESLTMKVSRKKRDRHGQFQTWEYRTPACATCDLASECTRSKDGRAVSRTEFDDARERLLEKTLSDRGKARAIRRMSLVEPRIGNTKLNQSLRKFARRGLDAVTADWNLMATVTNVATILARA